MQCQQFDRFSETRQTDSLDGHFELKRVRNTVGENCPTYPESCFDQIGRSPWNAHSDFNFRTQGNEIYEFYHRYLNKRIVLVPTI